MVQLHKTLAAVVNFAPDSTLTAQVHKSAESILRKEWTDAKDMKVKLSSLFKLCFGFIHIPYLIL